LGPALLITPTHSALTIVTLSNRTYKKKALKTARDYPVPLHLQPACAELIHAPLVLPHSEKAAVEVLTLPLYPEMTHHQIQRVAQALTHLVKHGKAKC